MAEETGLIESIGDWVIGAVCAQQVASGPRAGSTPQHLLQRVARASCAAPTSPRASREHLRGDGRRPRAAHGGADGVGRDAEDPAHAEPILRELHELGLRLALDDFGAGYSSLSRLREMPVTTLKIDRAFLRDVPESREAAAIVTAILQLARALGRTAVAEGVETEAQRAFLAEQGCPLAQGFLLARPMPPARSSAAHGRAGRRLGPRLAERG